MKKLFIPLSLLATSAISAADLDSRVSKLESNETLITTHSYANHTIAKLANSYPIIKDPVHLKLEIGAVYQTIQLGSTEFGYSYSFEMGKGPTFPYNGILLEPKSNLTWGLNLAASYLPFLQELDLRFSNSYFENHSNLKRTVNVLAEAIDALNANDLINNMPQRFASTNLTAGYDLLGFEIGRASFISKRLGIRPFYGLISSWIWIKQHSTYNVSQVEHSSYETTKSHWFGIGPQFGLNSNVTLTKNFSLFANSKGALMYGSFKNSHVSSDSFADTFDIQTAKISDKKVIPYLEVIVGGSYEYFDKNEKNHFKVRAGYDVQYFVSANQSILFSPGLAALNAYTRAKDDISTQGLILDLAWSF